MVYGVYVAGQGGELNIWRAAQNLQFIYTQIWFITDRAIRASTEILRKIRDTQYSKFSAKRRQCLFQPKGAESPRIVSLLNGQ